MSKDTVLYNVSTRILVWDVNMVSFSSLLLGENVK